MRRAVGGSSRTRDDLGSRSTQAGLAAYGNTPPSQQPQPRCLRRKASAKRQDQRELSARAGEGAYPRAAYPGHRAGSLGCDQPTPSSERRTEARHAAAGAHRPGVQRGVAQLQDCEVDRVGLEAKAALVLAIAARLHGGRAT
eukprot:1444569-Rhodomonas_salina.3